MKYELKEEDIVNIGKYRGKDIRMSLPDKYDFITRRICGSRKLYQEDIFNNILNLIPLNPTVIDIGAYTGSSTIWFSTTAGAKHVISLEPDEYLYSILDTNIRLNNLANNVTAIQAAVGDTDGMAKLSITSVSNLGATQYRQSADGEGDVKMICIDSLLDANKEKIDVIHVSMEGNEYLAIKGAAETIKKDKPVIIMDLWSPTTTSINPEYDCLFGYTKLISEFVDLGYVVESHYNEKVIFAPGDIL